VETPRPIPLKEHDEEGYVPLFVVLSWRDGPFGTARATKSSERASQDQKFEIRNNHKV
jgi:hypothetical protein